MMWQYSYYLVEPNFSINTCLKPNKHLHWISSLFSLQGIKPLMCCTALHVNSQYSWLIFFLPVVALISFIDAQWYRKSAWSKIKHKGLYYLLQLRKKLRKPDRAVTILLQTATAKSGENSDSRGVCFIAVYFWRTFGASVLYQTVLTMYFLPREHSMSGTEKFMQQRRSDSSGCAQDRTGQWNVTVTQTK